jgi:UPF0716 family protein affecting phage T7 exclusion
MDRNLLWIGAIVFFVIMIAGTSLGTYQGGMTNNMAFFASLSMCYGIILTVTGIYMTDRMAEKHHDNTDARKAASGITVMGGFMLAVSLSYLACSIMCKCSGGMQAGNKKVSIDLLKLSNGNTLLFIYGIIAIGIISIALGAIVSEHTHKDSKLTKAAQVVWIPGLLISTFGFAMLFVVLRPDIALKQKKQQLARRPGAEQQGIEMQQRNVYKPEQKAVPVAIAQKYNSSGNSQPLSDRFQQMQKGHVVANIPSQSPQSLPEGAFVTPPEGKRIITRTMRVRRPDRLFAESAVANPLG